MVGSVTATFLFTDLVGSTEIASALGPGPAEALRQEHFGLLRDAITAAGGTEVKNLGDGLMVMFSSPSRALACAVGMQQAIDRRNRRSETSLAIRVGIAAGEATEESGDYFGEPVVVASRLCARADGGRILTADVVRALVGQHAAQELVSVGALELKGLPEPVPASEVMWESEPEPESDGHPIPLPARLIAGSDALFAFFGRVAEVETLGSALKGAQEDGCLRVVSIGGEPGMGKTTLAAQGARSAHGDGAAVIFGSCQEGLGVPYAPWLMALAHLIDHAPPSTLESLRAPHAAALARLLPDRADRLPAVDDRIADDDRDRFLLFEAVGALLEAQSRLQPVIVVLDDMHWADDASLQLLRHLVASSATLHVLTVLTYRDSELPRGHPLASLLTDLHGEPRAERIALRGLADAEIAELIEAAAGHELGDTGVGMAHALRRETDGNPFFVTELLRHLGETGAIVQDDEGRYDLAGDLGDLTLPGSVRDVVSRRVVRLGEETMHVLSVAAVIGREFDVDVLASVADVNEDTVIDLLDAAMRAALVVEDRDSYGRYRFVHALIPHTLEQELSGARRQRLHRRIAETLEANGADAAAQARHWIAATQPTDAAKAIEYARRAGDAAMAALAPADALPWYRQALELVDRQPDAPVRERALLLLAIGRAEIDGGGEYWAPLMEAAALARAADDTDLIIDVALCRGYGGETVEFANQERLALLEDAIRRVGDADSAARAQLLAVLAEELDPIDYKRRRAYAEEALTVVRRVGDARGELEILRGMLPDILATPDRLEQRRADVAVGIDIAAREEHVTALFWLHRAGLLLETEAADVDAAAAHLATMRELATSSALPVLAWNLLSSDTTQALMCGRLDEAQANASALLEAGLRMRYFSAAPTFGAVTMNALTQRGRSDEALEIFEPIARDNPSVIVLRSALMMLYCQVGRLDEARVLFAGDVAARFTTFPEDGTWMASMARLADVALALHDTEAAEILLEKLTPYSGRLCTNIVVVTGAVDMFLANLLGVLGRHAEVDELFPAALDLHERFDAKYLAARTRIDWAESLRERGEPVGTLLDDALHIAREFGFAGLVARAAALR